MIGIKKIPLQKIKNEKGNILKFLSKKIAFSKNLGKYIFQKLITKKQKAGITTVNVNAIFQLFQEKYVFIF